MPVPTHLRFTNTLGKTIAPNCCGCNIKCFCQLAQIADYLGMTSKNYLIEQVMIPNGLMEIVRTPTTVTLRVVDAVRLGPYILRAYDKDYWDRDYIVSLAG